MKKYVVCKKCNNLVNDWCEKMIDSPDPDMQRECQYFCEKTNADRIRAMSDDELAVFMFSMVDCISCQNKLMNNGKLVFGTERKTCTDKDYYAMCGGDGRKCKSVCLEWLQQPAEGGKA